MSSDHLPILIGLQTTATSSPARHRTYINLMRADWTGYKQVSFRHLPTDCQKDEKLFRATLLKASSHHIPTGRRKLYTQQVPAEIVAMMEGRDAFLFDHSRGTLYLKKICFFINTIITPDLRQKNM